MNDAVFLAVGSGWRGTPQIPVPPEGPAGGQKHGECNKGVAGGAAAAIPFRVTEPLTDLAGWQMERKTPCPDTNSPSCPSCISRLQDSSQ